MLGARHAINHSGRYLIMERFDDPPANLPAGSCKVPVWVTDRKASMFGMAGGLVKVRDYGQLSLGPVLMGPLFHTFR